MRIEFEWVLDFRAVYSREPDNSFPFDVSQSTNSPVKKSSGGMEQNPSSS